MASERAAGLMMDAPPPAARNPASQQQQQYQRGMRELAARRGGAEPPPADEAGRTRAVEALRAMQQRRDALAQRLALARRGGDREGAAAYRNQLQLLAARERDALRLLGGVALRDFVEGARRTADDLHAGRRGIGDLSPREFGDMVTFHAGRPASDLLDAPGAPAPVGQALRRFHAGLAGMRRDGGRALLAAFNELFGHELQGLVGQHGYDGSTVITAQFAAPVPHPGSRHHLVLMLRLQLRDPDGRSGEQHVPLTDDHGHILAHPEESSAATVRNFHLRDLFNHIGALESLYRAVNADPRSREKLVAAFMQGHEEKATCMLDWLHLLGRDPEQWMPRRGVSPEMPDEPAAVRAGGSAAVSSTSQEEVPARRQAVTAAADPYQRGRLYLGHDGRKARYLGGGNWGAP